MQLTGHRFGKPRGYLLLYMRSSISVAIFKLYLEVGHTIGLSIESIQKTWRFGMKAGSTVIGRVAGCRVEPCITPTKYHPTRLFIPLYVPTGLSLNSSFVCLISREDVVTSYSQTSRKHPTFQKRPGAQGRPIGSRIKQAS